MSRRLKRRLLQLAFLIGSVLWISMSVYFFMITSHPKKTIKKQLPAPIASTSYLYSFEEMEGYDLLYENVYDRTSVIRGNENIMNFWVLSTDQVNRSIKFDRIDETYNKLTVKEFGKIIELIYKQKAFLVDFRLFNETIFKEKNLLKEDEFSDEKVHQINLFSELEKYFNSNQKETLNQNKKKHDEFEDEVYLTFGVSFDNVRTLDRILLYNFNQKCKYRQISTSYSEVDEKFILASLYIVCNKLIIQVAVFYTRGDFYWIPYDSYFSGNKKLFGDKIRSMNKFKLVTVLNNFGHFFYVPSNLKRFAFDYDHSVFIECDTELAEKTQGPNGPNYNQNADKNTEMMMTLQYVVGTMSFHKKNYWLHAGTLLGWYRDCGILPHANDIDLAMFAEEYERKIKQHFLTNPRVYLKEIRGEKNDGLQIKLARENSGYFLDISFAYRLNDTHQYFSYGKIRKKYRRIQPYFVKTCSGELFNKRYMVPCNPREILDQEFGGVNWHEPMEKNYKYINLKYIEQLTDEKWKRSVSFYNMRGFDKKKTIEFINKYADTNVTDLKLNKYN